MTSLSALRARHLNTPVRALARDHTATQGGLAAIDEIRPTGAAVGTEAWLRLLGEGGIEDVDEALW